MADVTQHTTPASEEAPSSPVPSSAMSSSDEVQRELEQARAMQRSFSPRLEPSVGSLVLRGAVRTLILWAILVLAFLGIWVFLGPVR